MSTNDKYHFQLNPPPPGPEALSGISEAEQLTLAINEIGNGLNIDISEALEKAQQALDAANNALRTANNALETAQNAGTAANAAQETANEALQKANEVTNIANNALARANEAYDLAATANTNATNAGALAQEALEAAQAAQTAANEARELAEQANNTAVSAEAQALEAMGIYAEYADEDGNSTTFNFNTRFLNPEKIYVNTETELINGPEITSPVFVDVHIASDQSFCRQFAYRLIDDIIYTRSASITGTGDDAVATWSDWEKLGEGTGGSGDNPLEAITVTNPNVDANLITNQSCNYLILNGIQNGPAGVTEAFAQLRSNKSGTANIQMVTDPELNLYQRWGESGPTPVAGTAFYLMTVTSGTNTPITETLVCRTDTDGTIAMRSQIGTNIAIDVSGSGASLSGTIDIFIPSSTGIDFKTDGFTFTITAENVVGPDTMSASFAADGTETLTSDLATYPDRCTVRYLYGIMDLLGDNNLAHINVGLVWTQTTGAATNWSDWKVLAASGGSVDETARAAAAAAQTTANNALAAANMQYDIVNNAGAVNTLAITQDTGNATTISPTGNLTVSIADIGPANSKTMTVMITPSAASSITWSYAGSGGITWIGESLDSVASGAIGVVQIQLIGSICIITTSYPV